MNTKAKVGTPEYYRSLHPFEPMDPNKPAQPITWLAPGIIMANKINVMFGPEKAGKSRLLAWVLAHMFYGEKLWGVDTHRPGKVLYLLGEETDVEVGHRILNYTKDLGWSASGVDWGKNLIWCQAAGMRLDKENQRTWLRKELEQERYSMVVIDPLRRVHGAKESSNDEMSYICNAFREWTNGMGITMVLLHHTGKLGPDDDEDRIATWSRGATDLPAVLDWATYVTRRPARHGGPDKVTVARAGRSAQRGKLHLLDHGEGGYTWELEKGSP